MKSNNRSLAWVIGEPLFEQLHKAARLQPASLLCDQGWDVTMFTPDAPWEKVIGNIRFIKSRWPQIYIFGPFIYHLPILINLLSGSAKYDVVIFHTESAPYLLPFALLRHLTPFRKTKIVMDTRSMIMDTNSTGGKLRGLSFKLCHWMARHLQVGQTAITREMARTVGIPKEKLLGIWPSGANVDEFAVSLSRRKWPGPEDPVRLMYLGALRPERNLKAVIDAVCLLKKEGLKVNLELVGSGSQRRELEIYSRAIDNGAIKVSPPVSTEEVPVALSRADVGLLPFPDLPEFRVSCAIKLFEYMSAGMAILATRIVAHKDVLDGSPFVFWAKEATPESLASAISEISCRKDSLPQMGARASAYAKKWTWEASAKSLSEALQKAVQDRYHPAC